MRFLHPLLRRLGPLVAAYTSIASAGIVDRDRIRQDLDPTNHAFITREADFPPQIGHRERHLLVGDFYKQPNYRAALAFARIFGRRRDLGALLNAVWHGLPTAGYNGLILDPRGQPMANAKFTDVKLREPFAFEPLAAQFIDKATRYGRPEAWVEYVLRLVREDHHVPRKDETLSYVEVASEYYPVYRDYVAITRRMMGFFDIAGGREGWLALRLQANFLGDRELETLRVMIERSPVVRGAVVMALGRVYTVTAAGVRTDELDPCENYLFPAERRLVDEDDYLETHPGRYAPVSPR